PDAPGEVDLFLLRDQRIPADLAQVLIQRAVIRSRSALGRADLNWTHARQLVGLMRRWPSATYPAPGASRNRSLVGVDLRPLQRAGVVHVAYLGFRVELVHLPPAFAVTVPGLLHAPERQMRLRPDGGRVDV